VTWRCTSWAGGSRRLPRIMTPTSIWTKGNADGSGTARPLTRGPVGKGSDTAAGPVLMRSTGIAREALRPTSSTTAQAGRAISEVAPLSGIQGSLMPAERGHKRTDSNTGRQPGAVSGLPDSRLRGTHRSHVLGCTSRAFDCGGQRLDLEQRGRSNTGKPPGPAWLRTKRRAGAPW
jgi:hypothetical protein